MGVAAPLAQGIYIMLESCIPLSPFFVHHHKFSVCGGEHRNDFYQLVKSGALRLSRVGQVTEACLQLVYVEQFSAGVISQRGIGGSS